MALCSPAENQKQDLDRMVKYSIICCHVLWREFCHYASLSENTFDLIFLEQGLHQAPDTLREELQGAIDAVDNGTEAILIGYGLCSNGIEGIVARNTRLVFVRGHDCITLLLGSKERYRAYFDEHPGTYWYSPGWIDNGSQPGKERYAKVLRSYIDKYGEDNAEYLMQMEQGWFERYSNAAYVDLGFGNVEKYKQFTQGCADWLGWNYDELSGDPHLLVRFLEGDWNVEDLLIVEPGHMVVATHDERIIDAVKCP